MDRPNKARIKQAIYVTSAGYPAVYTLVVNASVQTHASTKVCFVPTYEFAQLNGTRLNSLDAAHALVRTMREHVEMAWRRHYRRWLRTSAVDAARARYQD